SSMISRLAGLATGLALSAPTCSARGAVIDCRGRRTVKRLPAPTPALSASTVPLCTSTKLLTSAKPRPRPPCARVFDPSAWRKRSNTYGKKSAGIPPYILDADDGFFIGNFATNRHFAAG